MTPKPPGTLVRYIKEGRCVVFVGAGLSAGAGLPTWSGLLNRIIETSSFPGGDEEAEELKGLVTKGKLLEVADHLKERLGSSFHSQLTEQVRGDTGVLPETFKLLMRIPFAAWVTTNYDKLLERAYSEVQGGFPRVLTHMDTEPLGRLLFDSGKFVLKAHGDIDRHGTVVLTSRDYAEIIHANPSFNAVFSSLLLTRALLFVGYSLSDPDFRLLMDRQFTAFKGFVPDRFALMGGMGQVEQDVLWRTARIRVLPYPEGHHGEVLNFLQVLKEAVSPDVKPAPAPQAPVPAPAAFLAQTLGAGLPAPASPRGVVLESLSSPAAEVDDATTSEATPTSVGSPHVALSVPRFTAPTSVPHDAWLLSLERREEDMRVRLTEGEERLFAQGTVPLDSLAELERCAEALFASRSFGTSLSLIQKAFARCLPEEVRQALGDVARQQGRMVVLRTSRELERLPWELLPVRDSLLSLSCALARAPVGIADAARGRPRVHARARVLLVGPTAEDREAFERFKGRYTAAQASARGLWAQEALPERVLASLEAERHDLVSLSGRVGFGPGEVSVKLHGEQPLTASDLRPGFSQHPPALLVLDAAFSAFLPAGVGAAPSDAPPPVGGRRAAKSRVTGGRDAFLRFATETGVGAFVGGFGPLTRSVADAFLLRLHEGLARGETVAQAVFQARVRTHEAFPDDVTPLQYVLSGYGDLTLR